MYSQCPECLTRFRVTAAALRAAHGTVRCGRCGSAFDALRRLSDSPEPDDDDGAALSALPMSPAGATAAAPGMGEHSQQGGTTAADDEDGDGSGAIVTEFHFSADDLEQVFVDVRDWQRQYGAATLEGQAPGTSAGSGGREAATDRDVASIPSIGGSAAVFVHEPEAVEDITLEGERIVIEGLPPDLDDDLQDVETLLGETPESWYPVLTGESSAGEATELGAVDTDATEPVGSEAAAASAAPVDHREPAGGEPGPSVEKSATYAAQAESVIEHPAPSFEQPKPSVTTADVADHAVTAAATSATAPPPIVPFRLRERATVLDEASDAADSAEAARTRRTALLWGVGSIVLALALVAQLTHRFAEDLARDATLGPLVRSIYARIGRPLPPNWDLGAFELQQWGSGEPEGSGHGVMTVRASLRNGADFAQPIPLLRLELEDRFGGTVARRDFEPAEYLKNPAQAPRQLNPGAKAEAELVLVDVSPEAVGYRLDVCLRDENQGLRCAQAPAGPR